MRKTMLLMSLVLASSAHADPWPYPYVELIDSTGGVPVEITGDNLNGFTVNDDGSITGSHLTIWGMFAPYRDVSFECSGVDCSINAERYIAPYFEYQTLSVVGTYGIEQLSQFNPDTSGFDLLASYEFTIDAVQVYEPSVATPTTLSAVDAVAGVPEISTWAMMGLGLLALGGVGVTRKIRR